MTHRFAEHQQEVDRLWETITERVHEKAEIYAALKASVELQSHYAGLLNRLDGGQRLQFPTAEAWINRLAVTSGWEATNKRRYDLIDLKQLRELSVDEIVELDGLQRLAGIKRELLTPELAWRADCPKMEAHCGFHCSVCEGMDHHWMPDSDDEINDGEPLMVCKHCPATRPIREDEDCD